MGLFGNRHLPFREWLYEVLEEDASSLVEVPGPCCEVKFDSHPRPFAFHQRGCWHDDCDCTVMFFTFVERGDDGFAFEDGLLISFGLEVKRWVLTKDFEPEGPAEIIQEILAHPKPELQDLAKKGLRTLKRMYGAVKAHYEKGTEFSRMSSSLELFSLGPKDMPLGGSAFPYSFNDGREIFSLMDYYCPFPSCPSNFTTFVVTRVPRRLGTAMENLGSATCTFGDECGEGLDLLLRPANPPLSPEHMGLLSRWIQGHPLLKDSVHMRARLVKGLGLDSPVPSVLDHAKSALPIQTMHTSRRVGPNDPCPCGRGRKFKKCCGKG